VTTSAGITASSLCAALIDGPEQVLAPVHRSDLAWQLAGSDGRVVACVATSTALRLPHAVVVASLPLRSSPVVVGGGTVGWAGARHRIRRWWQPARPFEPRLRRRIDDATALEFAIHWKADLGRGDGLTPYADDVICGALILLRATRHPMADLIATDLANVDLEDRTTAASAALLRHAADGWCIDPLADYLSQLAAGHDHSAAEKSLLRVGHSSGAGLLEGIALLLDERSEGAAA
jgi:hypothetical protein